MSIVVGAAAAVWAYRSTTDDFRYAAFFAGFLALINFSEYRRPRQGRGLRSAFDIDGPAVPGGGAAPAPARTPARPGPVPASGAPAGWAPHRPACAPAGRVRRHAVTCPGPGPRHGGVHGVEPAAPRRREGRPPRRLPAPPGRSRPSCRPPCGRRRRGRRRTGGRLPRPPGRTVEPRPGVDRRSTPARQRSWPAASSPPVGPGPRPPSVCRPTSTTPSASPRRRGRRARPRGRRRASTAQVAFDTACLRGPVPATPTGVWTGWPPCSTTGSPRPACSTASPTSPPSARYRAGASCEPVSDRTSRGFASAGRHVSTTFPGCW